MEIVALLPMKANSERVKGKNFKPLGGRPLFQWMLDTLISMDEIAKVVINTDAIEILNTSPSVRNSKVVLKERKAELCGDFVSMNRILADDIAEFTAEVYLMTHTTNPFISKSTLSSAIAYFEEAKKTSSADSLFSVDRCQDRFYDKNLNPINHNPNELVRTQDLDPLFRENSNFYLFSKDSFDKTQARIGLSPVTFETPFMEALDIDETYHWNMAELIAAGKN
jgi:CMP-N-acetylneuraminic acid synthetase